MYELKEVRATLLKKLKDLNEFMELGRWGKQGEMLDRVKE
jgi:hypothetical protein